MGRNFDYDQFMSNCYTIQAIASSRGYKTIDQQALAEINKEAMELVTKILNISNRVRKHKHCQQLRSRDINEVLESKRLQPIYGYDGHEIPEYQQIGVSECLAIYANPDPMVKLSDVISEPLKKYPSDLNYKFHWLSYHGIQPILPENQQPPDYTDSFRISTTVGPQTPQLNFNDQSVAIVSSTPQLSGQLQAYFFEIIEKISSNPMIFDQVSKDPSVQPLVPFLLQYINEYISHSRMLEQLMVLLKLTRALFSNKNIDTEIYTLNFISIAMTLLLNPRPLCEDFTLRELSADFLSEILKERSAASPNISQNIADELTTLLLMPNNPPTSKYGAALGLMTFGPELIRTVILPRTPALLEEIKKRIELNQNDHAYYVRLKAVLNRMCSICFHTDTMHFEKGSVLPCIDSDLAEVYSQLLPYFGNDFLSNAGKPFTK